MPPVRTSAFSIKNKDKRASHNASIRRAAEKTKREERFERKKMEARDPKLKEERLHNNVPQTLESKRVWDDRVFEFSQDLFNSANNDVPDDSDNEDNDDGEEAEQSKQELAAKDLEAVNVEMAGLFSGAGQPGAMPKLLLTSTRNGRSHAQFEAIADCFPNTTYVPRGNKFSIPEICGFATKREYTGVIVVLEDSKKVHGLIIIVLPLGPTFHFSITSWTDGAGVNNSRQNINRNRNMIEGKGRPTNHIPELILNNFVTPLGKVTASLFQSLYPQVPEFEGRQVVTLHNQRDYIFFRKHRYAFRDVDKAGTRGRGDRTTGAEKLGGKKAGEDVGIRVGLQELGPRFTLKLRKVERGICEGVEWEWKGKMEKNRKQFQL